MARIGIVYYSMYGNTFDLAGRIADGVREAGGTADLRRTAELLPREAVEAQGLDAVIERQSDVPEARVDELPEFDGIIFGSGTFTGASTIHGGHESTILTMSTLAYHGMVIVGAGYAAPEVGSTRTGGSPYGPTAFNPQEGKEGLSDDEVAIARHYGSFFHGIAAKLAA